LPSEARVTATAEPIKAAAGSPAKRAMAEPEKPINRVKMNFTLGATATHSPLSDLNPRNELMCRNCYNDSLQQAALWNSPSS
jgi:hypothetical protein